MFAGSKTQGQRENDRCYRRYQNRHAHGLAPSCRFRIDITRREQQLGSGSWPSLRCWIGRALVLVPRCVQPSFCSATDLVLEESARPSAPALFQAAPANLNLAEEIRSSERAESAWSARWKPHRQQDHDGGRVLSLEECNRNVRRYAAGVMPVARRNARVKFDSEENRQASAISRSDARPVAIMTFALSSRL